MADRIRLRRDTAANWASVNPTLQLAEAGWETDTGKIKLGNGTSAWNDLDYSAKSVTWKGAYSVSVVYKVLDAVSYNGQSYICTALTTAGTAPTVTANWAILAEKGSSLSWKGAYSSVTAYAVNDAVSSNGSSYVCILAHTNQPVTNATYWALLAQKGDTGATGAAGAAGATGQNGANGASIIWKGEYSNTTAYAVLDAVSYNGQSYICKVATTGNLPTDNTKWDLMAQKGADGAGGSGAGSGLNWLGVYSGSTAYVVDDAVSYNGSSYICIQNGTGNLPTNSSFWSLMASKGDAGSVTTVAGTTSTVFTAATNGQVEFYPINGYTTTSVDAYSVSVGGVDQRPTVDYIISSANSGKLVLASGSEVKVGTVVIIRAYKTTTGGNGSANTGDITFSGTSISGPSSTTLLGDIELHPNPAYDSYGQYVTIRPTSPVEGNHIHIDRGPGATIYLGNDDQYVSLKGDESKEIEIGVPQAETTGSYQIMQPIAAGSYVISIPMAGNLWIRDVIFGSIVTYPNGTGRVVSISEYLGQFHITLDEPIVAGLPYFSVVAIAYKPRKRWTFKSTGEVTFPDGTSQTSAGVINGSMTLIGDQVQKTFTVPSNVRVITLQLIGGNGGYGGSGGDGGAGGYGASGSTDFGPPGYQAPSGGTGGTGGTGGAGGNGGQGGSVECTPFSITAAGGAGGDGGAGGNGGAGGLGGAGQVSGMGEVSIPAGSGSAGSAGSTGSAGSAGSEGATASQSFLVVPNSTISFDFILPSDGDTGATGQAGEPGGSVGGPQGSTGGSGENGALGYSGTAASVIISW